MIYVALLRGVNVGGRGTISMSGLRSSFEQLGFDDVRTYINSGNIIFRTDETDQEGLTKQIEAAIERDFGLRVPVLLRNRDQLEQLVGALPKTWVNDAQTKCDVIFLGPAIDSPAILEHIPHRLEIEDVVYYPGAVVWRVDRAKTKPGQVLKIIGSDISKQLTVRNPNTVRKIYEMMLTADNHAG